MPRTPMLIDTHCHLDASEFDVDRDAVVQRAVRAGVGGMVIPAVQQSAFKAVAQLAAQIPGGAYALGIHPLYVLQARDSDLDDLERAVQVALLDPRFVAIGEIGLDFFVPELCEPKARHIQEHFYQAQLDIAQRHNLPVILHVRRSQDALLKALRRRAVCGGIAHAFNGSLQQATQFVDKGFALGMGGAMTFPRALQIRRLATSMPLDALVLETDAPDIPPAWLGRDPGHGSPDGSGRFGRRNEPAELARIALQLAQLRSIDIEVLSEATAASAQRVLPRLAASLSS